MDSGQQDEDTDFLFDIVVTNLELYKPVNEPDQLQAQVKFGGVNINITSSRINVREFENNRVTQLTVSPSALRQSLENQGMQISARYAGSSLGSNVLLFPDTFIDKIGPTMSDLFFEDTINLMRRVDCIGTISIRLVLIVKCTDLDIIKEPRRSSSRRSSRRSSAMEMAPKKVLPKENCQGLGPTFNPQDVMFVIGDPDPLLKIPLEPCSELAFEEGDVRLDLDLQRYRSLENRRVVFPDDDPCSKDKPSISQLRQLTLHYSRIIGMVTDKINQMNQMNVQSSSVDPPSEKSAPSSITPKEPVEDRRIPVPIKDETDNNINPIRFCPICLCSMSWLPKYANCPNCNATPVPVLEDHHSHKLTADEIVEELLKPKQHKESEEMACKQCQDPIIHTKKLKKKSKSGLGEPIQISESESESDSGEECPPCRCTCSAVKTCAHCRIRKMCEDVFNGEKQSPQEQEKHIEVPRPCKDEDFCVISSPSNDRPYLSRVLNELKDLYHLHDTKKLLDMQKRCESQTLLPIESRPTISLRHAPNAFVPYVPGTLNRQTAGHKTCLPETHYVPRFHGWDWPRSWLAKKYGWRPGAILRAAGQVMRFFLMRKKDQRIPAKQDDRGHPILNIRKRDGVIFVTLRALDMKQHPITFRIVKSELAVAVRQIKRALKDQGFRKCTCHKSLMLCTCRDALEKFELNKALKKECQRRIVEPCPEHLVLTDTSISDLEFNLDVTPPTGTSGPKSKALQNMVSHGTQTQKKGKPSIEPKYPPPDSPYWRAFDCAAGDHYMGTAFGDNVETVFEDGIFGYGGGGQHGKAPCRRDPRIWGKRTGAPMPIGTAHDAIDPYRFTRSVWKTLPKNIIRQMHTNRKL